MNIFQNLKHPLSWLLISCLLLSSLFVGAPSEIKAEEANENLLPNAGFEQLDGDLAADWDSNAWGSGIEVSAEAARSGDWGIEIQNGNYWIRQTVPIVGGEPYEVSAWVLSDLGANGSLEMKLEFYRDTTNLAGSQGEHRSERYGSYDEWEKITTYAEAPPEANLATVYFRLYGSGTVYYDDVSFHQIEYIPGVNILADRLFYYEDSEEGKVTGTIGPEDGVFEDKIVNVSLYPEEGGDPVLSEEITAEHYLHYTFDPKLMTLQEPYILEVALKTEQDEILFTDNEKIYRWERPEALREDGTLIVDGEPFFPVIGYHVLVGEYGEVNDTINTVQGMRRKAGNETIEYHLDEAHKHGLKVLMPLYPSVGEDLYGPDGIPHVQEIVSNFKDHPAVIGWMIRDEPDIRGHAVEDLAEVYREIRSLDSVHPTYMVIAGGSAYENYFRATDIAAADIYPMPNGPITRVGSGIDNATSMFSERPVYSILQTFQTTSYPYLPNITEVRHMAYQSILEGAKGIGYYSYSDPNWDIKRSTLYPGILDFYEKDLAFISDFVVNGEQTAAYKDDEVQWGLWEMEDTIYGMVLNLTEETQTATVSLPAHDGYQVEVIAPNDRQASIFSNEINVELTALETSLVKFTPVATSTKLLAMVDDFANDGQFTNPGIARALTVHMTAIQRFEQQGESHKVLNHMEGFQALLEQHHASGLILEEAYMSLSSQADLFVDQKIKSQLHLNVQLDEQKVTAGEMVTVEAQLEHGGGAAIHDATVTVSWPGAFGIHPEEIHLSEISDGQIESIELETIIPEGTSIGKYPVNVGLTYHLNGQEFAYDSVHQIQIVPQVEVDFLVASQNIRAIEPGQHEVTLSLTNNASEPIEVMWSEETPEPIWFDLDTVQVGAHQTVEIEGVVNIGGGLSEDEYIATVHAQVDGESVGTASLTVNFTQNLIENPGFEIETEDLEPLGWNMRSANWVQDVVHSGQYAVTLLPDSENEWNVMNARDNISVNQEDTYRLSGWVKLGSANDSVGIGVRQMNANNGTVEYLWNFISNDHTDWAYYELVFVPTEETVSVQPTFYMSRQPEAQAWFDDFRLENITDELPPFSANLETTSIHASSTGAYPFTLTLENSTGEPIEVALEGESPNHLSLNIDSLVSLDAYEQIEVQGNVLIEQGVAEGDHHVTVRSSVYGEDETIHELSLPIHYMRNLLQNPSFEEGSGSEPDGWQTRAAEWTQDEVQSGQYSLSLIPDSENAWNVFNSRERLPVMQDTTYRLSWSAKLGSDDDSASIGIRETDDDYTLIHLEWKHFTDQSDWTRYEMEFTPTDPSTKYIQVFGYIGRQNSEPVWYDDFRFEIIEE